MRPSKQFIKNSFLAVALFGPLLVNATGVEAYKKRFILVKSKSTGSVVAIRDRVLDNGFTLNRLMERMLKEWAIDKLTQQKLLSANTHLSSKDLTKKEVNSLIFSELDASSFGGELMADGQQYSEYMTQAVEKGRAAPVVAALNDKKVQGVLKKFETKIGSILAAYDYNLVAKLDDPFHFYRGTVTKEIISVGLDMAKKQVASIPFLNVAVYVMVRYVDLVQSRRLYHQNMLLHYLESLTEEELGLSKEERKMAMSSIYESRIAATSYNEAKAAKEGWADFGSNIFFAQLRNATRSFEKSKSDYSEVGERLNYAFQDATYKGKKVILNLFDKRWMYSQKPSIAYYYAEPNRVKRARVLIQLAQIGLHFVPVHDFIKTNIDKFASSLYQSQVRTEGALAAYFDSKKNQGMKQKVISQSINPFIPLD